jgi:hypothetical protein
MRRVDGWLAVGAGFGFVALSAQLAPDRVRGTWLDPEIGPACAQLVRGTPGLVQALGAVDAVVAVSLLCTALLGVAIYGWGAQLGGRLGGAFAVGLAALSPVVTLHRSLTLDAALALGVVAAGLGIGAVLRPAGRWWSQLHGPGVLVAAVILVPAATWVWPAVLVGGALGWGLGGDWLSERMQRLGTWAVGVAVVCALAWPQPAVQGAADPVMVSSEAVCADDPLTARIVRPVPTAVTLAAGGSALERGGCVAVAPASGELVTLRTQVWAADPGDTLLVDVVPAVGPAHNFVCTGAELALDVPADLGPATLVVFIDLDHDGPQLTDPSGARELRVGPDDADLGDTVLMGLSEALQTQYGAPPD